MISILRFLPAVAAVFALSACESTRQADVERALDPLNVIDESNLNSIMLNTAAPEEAVNYFRRSVGEDPDRIDFQRGLAVSLVRAGRAAEAVPVWQRVLAHEEVTEGDRVEYADALIRNGNWAEAQAQLDAIRPTYETYERYRLEAMIADSEEDWPSADSFYETAAGLTTTPANVYNNWGYSHLTRGDFAGAEEMFMRAISYDPDLFTAKNNLVLARAAQGNYQLPLVNMTQIERANLLHTAALAAIRRGDVQIGRGLLNDAIDTHPQHFAAAVDALRTLEAS